METLSKSVTLRDGLTKKTLHPLRWPAWKKVKTRLAQLLGQDHAARLLVTMAEAYQKRRILSEADGAKKVEGSDVLIDPAVLRVAPQAVELFTTTIDDLTEEIVADCLREPLPELDAADMLLLRDACNDLVDWPTLLSAEKNSLAGVFQNLIETPEPPKTADDSAN